MSSVNSDNKARDEQRPPRSLTDNMLDDLWRPGDDADASQSRSGPEFLLLSRGDITRKQLDEAVEAQQNDPRLSVLEVLVASKAIDEMQALRAVAEYFRLPFKRITPEELDENVMGLLPRSYLHSKHVLPLREEKDAIVVAVSNPNDIFLEDDLKQRLRSPVRLVVAPKGDIVQTIDNLSADTAQHVDKIVQDFDEEVEVVEENEEEESDLEAIAGESPVIRYVNYLITNAVKEGASDIHIEPGEKRLRVRYRMDGVLFEQTAPPVQMQAAILSRLKIMANLDIAERRVPQDGRIRAQIQRRSVDLRVSTLPVVHGEKCVIRILDNRSISVGLANLGMQEDTLAAIRHQILQPHGVVLVTGPTGSGKSTTLYSALQIMDHDRLNISTVEDPVEYELAAVNQVGVRDSIGMSFAAALRSLLRQDPDVIMVGEIRDVETARVAVQASLTGHLVLSTLHTNDAPSTITRLINIGVEAYLLAASLNAVLAQRLVRKICPDCRERVDELPEREQRYLEKCEMPNINLHRGAGCDRCRNTGYRGRLGLYELLILEDEIRDLVTDQPALSELRSFALKKGMRTLNMDGLQKVDRGMTTVEEIMRVTES